MRVFVSAAPSARAFCTPEQITGFEIEVPDGTTSKAVYGAPIPPRPGDDPEIPHVHGLTARRTGRHYHALPWWEIS